MSSAALPEPYTTADIDVRDMDGFMLNTERLLASELWALSTGEEFKAAMGLWCRAWKQIPAASLPDDERVLASFAGVPQARWKKVRLMAMRGFDLCSDGRLYHKVLAEDAKRAMAKKAERRERTKAATAARKNGRDDQRNVQRHDARNDDRDDERNVDRGGERNEVPETRQGSKKERIDDETIPGSCATAPQPEGQRAGDEEASALIEAADRVIAEHYGRRRPRRHREDLPLARSWAERGISPDRLAAILDRPAARFAEARPDDMPIALKLFASDVDREEPASPYPPGIVLQDDRQWFDRVTAWSLKSVWPKPFGPPPNDPETRVPDHVLAARGLARRRAAA